MEGDSFCLDFAFLDINLVTAKDNRDILADSDKIAYTMLKRCAQGGRVERRTVPIWDVLVGDARRYVKHDDTTLAVNVVSISETAKLLLSSRIPDIEGNLTEIL